MFSGKWAERDAIKRILERSIEDCQPVDGWQFVKYQYADINVYHKVADGNIFFHQMWDNDGTYYFYREIMVPETRERKDWYLAFDIGGECEVYVNEKPKGSLDSNHQTVLIAEETYGGEKLSIKVQATRHEHEYVRSERMTGKSYGYHIFRRVNLFSRNNVLYEFSFLAKTLLDFTDCDLLMKEEQKELLHLLKDVLYEVDYFADTELLETQVKRGEEEILKKLEQFSFQNRFGESLFMGHSHLDLVFKWTYKETFRKIERTLSNTVYLLKRYPNATYVQSQMCIVETLQRAYPDLYKEFQELLRNGNIEVVGDVYSEFDSNIPSGESLIRQFLIGRKIAKSVKKTNSKVCYLPDTFGYSGILPQILRQAGYEYFVTAKLGWNDTNPPEYFTFMWKGIDGSRIKTHLLDSYGGDPSPLRLNERSKDDRCRQAPIETAHIYQYGAGDGGGGISEENLLTIQAVEELGCFTKVKHVTLEQAMNQVFSEDLQEDLPVKEGELYFERHRGVYTSQAKIKRENRFLEQDLHRLEFLQVISFLKGNYIHKEEVENIWKLLLFNQFHDIIAGSCIHTAIKEAEEQLETARELCKAIENDLLKELMSSQEGSSIVNPLGVTANGMEPFSAKSITIDEIDLCESMTPMATNVLENSKYRMVFDENGEIDELYDKNQKRQVLRGKGNVFTAHVDRGGYFESWDISEDIERKVYPVHQLEELLLIEDGPVRKTIQIKKRFRSSLILQKISIYKDSASITFDTTVDFKEPQMLLKVGFDVDVDSSFATYDISMGNLKRETTRNSSHEKAKYEVCMHKFFDLSEETHGVAVFSDCKYGCDTLGNRMRLTLIKTATFPDETQDIGEHRFSYGLYPHEGDVMTGRVRESAYQFQMNTYHIKGKLEIESPIVYQEDGVILETMKVAEDGSGIMLRFYEHRGQEKIMTLQWRYPFYKVQKCNVLEELIEELPLDGDNTFCLKIKPYEIVTLKII